MDASRFSNYKTGELVAIGSQNSDFAFVPDPLPPKWEFSARLWHIYSEAWGELSRLDGMARTLPNPHLLLNPLQRSESLTSSRLEGTFATAEEMMMFELNPRDPRSANDPANGWLEVYNYSNALRQGFQQLETLPFCLRVMKDLHKTLLTGVRGHSKNPGEFRAYQVHIGSNKRYIAPPPDRLSACMNSLEIYLNNPNDTLHPLVRCFVAHYQLEAIHPFCDGNGRIGRVLLSLMIYKWCSLSMPWLYMSPYFERYKDEYFDNLFRVSTEGDWEKWIEFCLRGVILQAKDATAKCDELRALREEMRDRISDGGARVHSIVDRLFSNPALRTKDAQTWFGVSNPTAKSDIDYLIKKQILFPLPQSGRFRFYYAPAISAIAYREQRYDQPPAAQPPPSPPGTSAESPGLQ